MPPSSLYPFPRHHMYGADLKRPEFNAKDFDLPYVDDMRTVGQINGIGEREMNCEEQVKKGKKKKDKSKKHRESHEPLEAIAVDQETNTASSKRQAAFGASSSVAPLTASPNSKIKRSRKDEGPCLNTSQSHTKKRKHEDDNRTIVPDTSACEPKKKSKKKKKSDRKSDISRFTETQRMEGLNQAHCRLGEEQDSMPKPSVISKSSPKKTHEKQEELGNGKSCTNGQIHASISSPAPKNSTPLSTPVKSAKSSISASRKAYQMRVPHQSHEADIIAPETPPTTRQMSRQMTKTPMPFPPHSSRPTITTPKLSKKERVTVTLSDSSSQIQNAVPFTVPAAIRRPPISKTPVPLPKMTQPLTDEPKIKPKRHPEVPRASSETDSLPSSRSSSVSIMDVWLGRSGSTIDPGHTAQNNRSNHRETHEEASLNAFNQRFNELQLSVNFDHEREYLNQYLDWQAENESEGPFPCLGRATGCTPKKEEILKLSREEDINIVKALGADAVDEDTLKGATQAAQKAEELLKLTICARIPVPIGLIEGTWKLYCPKYSAHHVDKYAFGERTLRISTIAGFKVQNTYTAKLSIPPRSVLYSILTFSTPPHASFRVTMIKTAAEGYKMDLIFLGNGFLQMRVDLNVLLRGKPTETVGGKKGWMEFVGVHERAVQWTKANDELEDEQEVICKR